MSSVNTIPVRVDFSLQLGESERRDPVLDLHLTPVIARHLGLDPQAVTAYQILHQSLDARQKPRLKLEYRIVAQVETTAAQAANLSAAPAEVDPFALAGVEAMTKLAASLVTALAALDARGEEEPLALWQAACLEEEWQAELWGRDWEAEERRERREADFLRACAFARMAKG